MSKGLDTLVQRVARRGSTLFLPWAFIGHVIEDRNTQGMVILMAPDWPRCSWYADLAWLRAD